MIAHFSDRDYTFRVESMDIRLVPNKLFLKVQTCIYLLAPASLDPTFIRTMVQNAYTSSNYASAMLISSASFSDALVAR